MLDNAQIVRPVDKSVKRFEKLLREAFNKFFNKEERYTHVGGIEYKYCKNACVGVNLSVPEYERQQILLFIEAPSNASVVLNGKLDLKLKLVDAEGHIVEWVNRRHYFKIEPSTYTYDGKDVVLNSAPDELIYCNSKRIPQTMGVKLQ